jgi:hypothetical protein
MDIDFEGAIHIARLYGLHSQHTPLEGLEIHLAEAYGQPNI